MKFFTVLLLPLAVSGSVARPRFETGTATTKKITPVRRQTAASPTESTSSSWLPTLAQVGSLIGSAYTTYNTWTNNYNDVTAKLTGALPDLLYAGVNNVAWYMSWTSKPVKIDRVQPVIDPTAQKRVIRYGPYTLLGSKVGLVSLESREPIADRYHQV
jgi:hypothetical protein